MNDRAVTNDDITELERCKDALGNSKGFAESLIKQYRKKGQLSVRQEPYVFKLIEQVKNPPKPVTKKLTKKMETVYHFFLNAQDKLKFPKIIATGKFGGDGVEDLKIHMAGKKSRVPGALNVTLPDRYTANGRNVWLGRIGPDGTWDIPPYHADKTEIIEPVSKFLIRLAEDPHAVAAEHGKLTGNCMFCNHRIGHGKDDSKSSEKSRAVGYGPGCAKNFGLLDKWNAAAGVKQPVTKGKKGARKVTTRARKSA